MRSRFLFPHQLRPVGWILAIPRLVLGYLVLYTNFRVPGLDISYQPSIFYHGAVYYDLTKTFVLMLVMAGLFLAAFSREKKEDELTAKIRYNSLYWSVLISYVVYLVWLVVVVFIEVFKLNAEILGPFSDIMTLSIYNLFTPLLIFIGRYYYLRYSRNGEYKVDRLFYLPERPFRLIGQITSVPLLLIILFALTGSWLTKGGVELKEWVSALLMILPLSLLVWGYSRRHNEDEFISTLRLESMQLAVYINYAILFVANLLFYFTDFLLVMFLNLGTVALFFVLRFSYILYKYNKESGKGELAV